MKKVIFILTLLVGIFYSSNLNAQVIEPSEVKRGCPDGFNVTIGPHQIIINCDDCLQYSSGGMYPTYTCPPEEAHKVGACLKCYELYDNLTIDDVVVNVLVIPALQRAWIYTIINVNGDGLITVDVENEIDILHLLTILNPGP